MKKISKSNQATINAGWNIVEIISVQKGKSMQDDGVLMNMRNNTGSISVEFDFAGYDPLYKELSQTLRLKMETIKKNPKVLVNKYLIIHVEKVADEYSIITDLQPVLNNEILSKIVQLTYSDMQAELTY